MRENYNDLYKVLTRPLKMHCIDSEDRQFSINSVSQEGPWETEFIENCRRCSFLLQDLF